MTQRRSISRAGFAGLGLAALTGLAFAGLHRDSGTATRLDVPSTFLPLATSTPTAGDPKVSIATDKVRHVATITAKNGPALCHDLRLYVLGEAGVDPQPQLELESGARSGKLYSFTDVLPGQVVTETLDAGLIVANLPRGQVFRVGAVGYCEDGR